MMSLIPAVALGLVAVAVFLLASYLWRLSDWVVAMPCIAIAAISGGASYWHFYREIPVAQSAVNWILSLRLPPISLPPLPQGAEATQVGLASLFILFAMFVGFVVHLGWKRFNLPEGLQEGSWVITALAAPFAFILLATSLGMFLDLPYVHSHHPQLLDFLYE